MKSQSHHPDRFMELVAECIDTALDDLHRGQPHLCHASLQSLSNTLHGVLDIEKSCALPVTGANSNPDQAG